MYVFGVDLPLVELILAVGIIGVIILMEITVILILITFHMRNSKKLEDQIRRLINALTKLEDKELKALDEIEHIRYVRKKTKKNPARSSKKKR